MDCGPAALTSLLAGFRIPVSYGRLREACQTDLDGTSIDTMEAVSNELGLCAEQIMLPLDHLLIPECKALPCLVVTQLADGMTHFVVVWRRHGAWLQIMDPAAGRRWVPAKQFLRDVYRHRMAVPAEGWREFAVSEDFQRAIHVRMRRLGIGRPDRDRLAAAAAADTSFQSLATLDAALRLLQSLREANAIGSSNEVTRLLDELQRQPELIPASYWSVRSTEPDEDGTEQVLMSGAVLVRALGKQTEPGAEGFGSEEVQAAAAEKPLQPLRELARYATGCGLPSLIVFAVGSVVSSAGVLVEALLFRSLLDITSQLHVAGQRAGAMLAVLAVSVLLLGLDAWLMAAGIRFGRLMEMQLRMAFLRKLPKLGDRYFQSRLTSDMAERSHVLHQLRHVADLFRQFASATGKLCFTAAALIWLEPSSYAFVLLMAGIALAIPAITQAFLGDRDLRLRSHAGALTRYVLDGLLGLVMIRAHGGERQLRSEQEKLLGRWGEAALRLQTAAVRVEAAGTISLFGLSVLLLWQRPLTGSDIGRVLLTVYWALNLPTYGQEMCALARKLTYYRNLTLRLLEPLGAPEEKDRLDRLSKLTSAPSVVFRDVSVTASGHSILSGINLQIESGSHVAVVGPSGAGKSSLVGLLLGWWKPGSGDIEVEGAPIRYEQVRRSTAWVDPGVQIWNRSLFGNIGYGTEAEAGAIATAVDGALLRNVLESLPDGLQSNLGEGGALVSGGEAQRVRLARAMLRNDAQLVLLDEPFRGLDREKRRELLRRARRIWQRATLICITHDIQETLDFDQVVVLENGRIAESGSPRVLMADDESRFAQLVRAEQATRSELWSGAGWRRIRVQAGRLVETMREASHHAEEEVA